MTLAVTPATPDDAVALAELFDREGSPCFCRYWHFAGTNKEWEARCAFDRDRSRDELVAAVRTRTVEGQGMVARTSARPGAIVGWLKLTPRAALSKLLARSPYQQLRGEGPAPDVFAIGCLLIDPAERRRGVARALVEGGIELARLRGARAIEAYPRDAREPLHDGEHWMGPRSLYDQLGFEAIHGDGGPYPVLRKSLS